MYPRKELTLLAARKTALRARIVLRRAECAERAAEAARPVAWLDYLHARWQAVPPWVKAGAPLLLVALRRGRPRRAARRHVMRKLLRWAPVALQLWRGTRAARSAG